MVPQWASLRLDFFFLHRDTMERNIYSLRLDFLFFLHRATMEKIIYFFI